MSAYQSATSQAAADFRPLAEALWVSTGVGLIIAALLAVCATPMFMVRRRALLFVAALTPLSMAAVQIAYLGFIPPTALLLFDSIVLIAAAELGRGHQPRPPA